MLNDYYLQKTRAVQNLTAHTTKQITISLSLLKQ